MAQHTTLLKTTTQRPVVFKYEIKILVIKRSHNNTRMDKKNYNTTEMILGKTEYDFGLINSSLETLTLVCCGHQECKRVLLIVNTIHWITEYISSLCLKCVFYMPTGVFNLPPHLFFKMCLNQLLSKLFWTESVPLPIWYCIMK